MIPGMKTRRVEPDIDIVELFGNLNTGHTLTLIETTIRGLIKNGSRKLILDVTQLRYADSAGIGMFIQMNGQMEQAGGSLRIAGADGMLAKTFSVVHIDRVLLMDPDVQSSCTRFGDVDPNA